MEALPEAEAILSLSFFFAVRVNAACSRAVRAAKQNW